MKIVPFRLEAVLNTKIAKGNELKQEFAKLQLELLQSEEILKGFEDEWDKSHQNPKKICGSNLLHEQFYKELLIEKMKDQRQEIIRKMELVANLRERLMQISKEKEAIEKLKKQHEENQEKMMLYEQQKFLDEIAVIRYGK